jgi:hypothetical protein
LGPSQDPNHLDPDPWPKSLGSWGRTRAKWILMPDPTEFGPDTWPKGQGQLVQHSREL